MTVLKRILVLTIVLLVAFQLAACGGSTPAPIATATTLPTSTLVIPISKEPLPTPSSTSTPTSSIPLSSAPDGLRMAYIIDGNLYFQDGSNSPIQLTYSGEDSAPIFSDDGEKIVFFRGANPSNIYSINIDGNGEQAIVTTGQLMNLNFGYDKSTAAFDITFLPGTHRLLFRTYQSQEGAFVTSNSDLLVVDTDTAEIKRLLPFGQVSAFYVSLDGKFIAIDAIGRIDVIDVAGKIIHKNLLIYTPSEPSFLPPDIFWMPDSTGLIFLLPIPTVFEVGDIPSYTVWRYELDGGTGAEVSLDPLPMEYYKAEVSPDGNWIIYGREDQNAFYVGDLRTGHTNLYEPQPFIYHYDWSWSPDSKHFIYRGTAGEILYLGAITDSPTLIGRGEFLGWINSNRYLYYADKNIVMGAIIGSKEIILADHESFKNQTIFTFILP